jgi:hypothetical protein
MKATACLRQAEAIFIGRIEKTTTSPTVQP